MRFGIHFIIGIIVACGGWQSINAQDNVLSENSKKAGWQMLFDGKTLLGWTHRGGNATWAVENGMLTGTVTGRGPGYIGTYNKFKDFEILLLDLMSILILNYIFNPLIAFTIYFCFLHSIRHIISISYELDPANFLEGVKIFIKKAWLLTSVTALLYLLAIFFLSFSYDLNNAIIKVIFIGLASLTFPHILLEYLIEINEKRN